MPVLARRIASWSTLLPAPVRTGLRRSGVQYVASYLARYRQVHAPDRFAGTLVGLAERYAAAGPAEREALLRRFDAVLDSLVLPNGVAKTTYRRRQNAALAAFLERPERPPDGSPLRVLDLPSSSGASSLDTLALLRTRYPIGAYVLGDLCQEVYLDPETGCVYDAAGRLLQVRTPGGFFSLYRSFSGGDAYSPLTRAALLPLALRARRLRRRHALAPGRGLVPLPLVHPGVQELARGGQVTIRDMDVFALDAEGEFDLAISFNLLQRSYFPPERIALGTRSLARALADGGFLLTGNSESFGIARKRGGRLEWLHREGEW
ncbi:MAG TPA: class I SAM-dependent methyltransferase [Longimicrobium sp.]